MSEATTIWWVRGDLRLDDNHALQAAIADGASVVPLFVWSPEDEGHWPIGAASRWWLHHSLIELDAALRALGSRLIVRAGPTVSAIETIVRETSAAGVYWNLKCEVASRRISVEVIDRLNQLGVRSKSFDSNVLFPPSEVVNRSGNPFQVFTPFWKTCLDQPEPKQPISAPKQIPGPATWSQNSPIGSLELLPKIDWAAGLAQAWTPGERGAKQRLEQLARDFLAGYSDTRDRPDWEGTSRLSPHLHFGEVSPRRIWHHVTAIANRTSSETTGAKSNVSRFPLTGELYLRQLGWREFAHHLLFHFPQTELHPLREEFSSFPWRRDAKALRRWQRGETGYPIVDAGMRELWATGWMHNRVRMIVASFLVKDLLIPWQDGARWFWDTLVDADLANNTLGWQWTAGCGADAAPYFRVFNPMLQGQKFDPDGDYVRRWVPELSKLSNDWIHRPWEASREVLDAAAVVLGKSYPHPIVDHAEARKRALAALEKTKS